MGAFLELNEPPPGVDGSKWAQWIDRYPGACLASWLEAMEGERPEVDGENRGPWLDRILYGRRVLAWLGRGRDIRGDAYCASILLSWMQANGVWLPPPPGPGLHWFWHNRAVTNLRRAFELAGCFAGPNVPPRRGWLCFHTHRAGSDAGGGSDAGHVDVVTRLHRRTLTVGLIGANLSDSFKAREMELGAPSIAGWGVIPPGGRA